MPEELGFEVRLNQPYDQALEKVITALKAEGFGVVTSIDVRATFHEKLGEDFRSYTILGACNPSLAHRALIQDPVVGLLLPCNVTVEEDSEDRSVVRFANPEAILTIGGLQEDSTINGVAREARARLERVADALLTS
jgi:uncharacterized protein (DUF302 family)